MSARDYAILWVGATKGVHGGLTALGGNALLTTPQHTLDGPEHLVADDTTTLDATTTEHGLLPKLSGDPDDVFRGDGTYAPIAVVAALDDLSDVTITSPASGDRLRYTGSIWVNSSFRWEPHVDYTGSVVLDGVGNPVMVEVL